MIFLLFYLNTFHFHLVYISCVLYLDNFQVQTFTQKFVYSFDRGVLWKTNYIDAFFSEDIFPAFLTTRKFNEKKIPFLLIWE